MDSLNVCTFNFGIYLQKMKVSQHSVLLSVFICVIRGCLLIQLFNIAAQCLRSQQAVCRRALHAARCVSAAGLHQAAPAFLNMQSLPSHLHAHERATYCQ